MLISKSLFPVCNICNIGCSRMDDCSRNSALRHQAGEIETVGADSSVPGRASEVGCDNTNIRGFGHCGGALWTLTVSRWEREGESRRIQCQINVIVWITSIG